ncbi:MAG: WcaF family extracellular polysaccharide biosynthesis acetyltransferase [Bacteroidia bacterium]
MGVDLSKYNNSWYDTGGSKFKVALWFIVKGIVFLNPLFPFVGFKVSVLRMFGAKVGRGVIIKPSVNIKYPWSLEIGNHVWIGEMVWIENHCKVTIGNNACLSQGATIMTGNHNYKKTTFDLIIKSVTLEDGVWIGANAIVCPGVICGSHSILTVNSVANQNLEPWWIYQGNPAEKIRERVMEG